MYFCSLSQGREGLSILLSFMRSPSSLYDNRDFLVTVGMNFDIVCILIACLLGFLELLFLIFKTGSSCVALAALKLTLYNRLASKSDLPTSAGTKGVCHHSWLSACL